MNKLLTVAILSSVGLSACGGHHSRAYKKQRTATAIKIDKLDVDKHILNLRFNYRSYVDKTLENIQCDMVLNTDISIKLDKTMSIQLGAFATEVINFNNIDVTLNQLQKLSSFDYSFVCQVHYDQGQETIRESSVLHLAPGEKHIYR